MFVSRVFSRFAQSSLLLSSTQRHQLPTSFNHFRSLVSGSQSKNQFPLLYRSAINSLIPQQFGFSSSASPKPAEKEHGRRIEINSGSPNDEPIKANGDAEISGQGGNTKSAAEQTKESDSDAEGNLSVDDLKKLVLEKEELLKMKHKEIERMQDKVLRAYADMENVMDRTKREAESSKKFAIQNFAKSLLDVSDNLGRASSVVKEGFSKIDTFKDSEGAVPLLKTLLEGVEMTEKQLEGVFRKFGVEKFDPTNEPFDPNRHNAVFQVPDTSKPPGTVAHVLKAGYVLYDRVIRPAEVGVTHEEKKDSSEE